MSYAFLVWNSRDTSTTQTNKPGLQLDTGYTQFSHYRNKLGQVNSDLCRCGQTETTEHYLLQCPLYELPRVWHKTQWK